MVCSGEFNVILNHRPLKGALFASAFPPTDELESLARVSGPNMALFYQNYEVILLAPPLKMIWPEAGLGINIDKLRAFVGDVVAPAEKLHLAAFWDTLKKQGGKGSDVFLLKSGRVRDVTMLGLSFFSFSWGNFLVAVPGEDPARVRENMSHLTSGTSALAFKALDRWVEDLETEYVLTHLLDHFPEDFRTPSGFLRTMHLPLPDGRVQVFEIAYKFRNKKWHRDIAEGAVLNAGTRGKFAWSRPGSAAASGAPGGPVVREKGVRVGNEIMINFTVFLGGVFPLGDIPVPVQILAGGGMVRVNRLIREISKGIVASAQSLTSEKFRFCRSWTESGFAISSLEEIARIISPDEWRKIMVLPFWETGPGSLAEVHSFCRVSDAFFIDPAKNMGLLLLRDCSQMHAREVVAKEFKKRVSAHVDLPMTVGSFLDGV